MTRKFSASIAFLFAFTAGLLFVVAQNFEKTSGSERTPAQSKTTYAVSGYLPDQPQKKVYVIIDAGKIQSIATTKPKGSLPVFETEYWIFPGLIDLHNHVKYGVLPLWTQAQGQFLNRFEWRDFPPYKDAVSFNIKAYTGPALCAAVRWSELRAITGGAIAIQGIGVESECGKNYGAINVDIKGDTGVQPESKTLNDIFFPQLMGRVYLPQLEKSVKEALKANPNQPERALEAYSQSLLKISEQAGLIKWADAFHRNPRTLSQGLMLLLNDTISVNDKNDPKEEFAKITPQLEQWFQGKTLPPFKNIPRQIEDMKAWLFGDSRDKGYLNLPVTERTLTPIELLYATETLRYIGKDGVYGQSPDLRDYLTTFESQRIRLSTKNTPTASLITHLAEGQRNDRYNRLEFKWLNDLSLAQKGFVAIHGVGMNKQDFEIAAKNGMSLVWSPFSNLLLYGETLDIENAWKAGVNVAMGPDWTPTGSKTMLDEMKLMRRYLDKYKIKSISDKNIVEMATINGAKALQLDHTWAKVEKNYSAHLLFVTKSDSGDPYSQLVNAETEDIQLVVISGQPTYGDSTLLKKMSSQLDKKASVQKVNTNCSNMDKSFWLVGNSDFDTKNPRLKTPAELEKLLRASQEQYKKSLKGSDINKISPLNPLYKCEDLQYQTFFANYIEQTLDQQKSLRNSLRSKSNLKNDWSPLD